MSLAETCPSQPPTSLSPFNVVINNAAGTAPIPYTITITDSVPGTQNPWAVAQTPSGTVPMQQTTKVLISPVAGICPNLPPGSPPAQFQVKVQIGVGQFTKQTAIADSATPAPVATPTAAATPT